MEYLEGQLLVMIGSHYVSIYHSTASASICCCQWEEASQLVAISGSWVFILSECIPHDFPLSEIQHLTLSLS